MKKAKRVSAKVKLMKFGDSDEPKTLKIIKGMTIREFLRENKVEVGINEKLYVDGEKALEQDQLEGDEVIYITTVKEGGC